MSEKNKFEAIAIVGRGCVLPGCQSVDDLWKIVECGRVETSSASEDDWHVNQSRLLSDNAGVYELDKMWSNHGGYVRQFSEHFDPEKFQIDKDQLDKLDPVFLWSLEAARQAMAELKSDSSSSLKKAGVILGNLSYPTRGHSKFAEEVWLKDMRGEGQIHTAAENRFMSGLPANIVAKGLGFGGNTLALDAACASGLYAIKIACDRLQSGSSDLMLAGAVNAADPLFIHMGFCALKALSKTGVSQPFSQSADGLVPSEGAAFVALKRLKDARADGDKIYGIIRGVGLSNDGRSGGFLSPSTEGQVDCIQKAYDMSSVDPSEIQFVECHATGTEAGDSTEIESLSTIFPEAENLPLGSLKGNLGHLITVSGVAGLLKIILAFENKTIPGTPNASPNLASIKEGGFTVPSSNQEWKSKGPRIAAISSFGFGGNNAHLIVQENSEDVEVISTMPTINQLAVVSLAVKTDQDANSEAFGRRVCSNSSTGLDISPESSTKTTEISLSAKSLAFPPNDLKEALGQQLILLDLLPEIDSSISKIPSNRVGVYVGMQTDSEVCRYGLRWRLQDLQANTDDINLDQEIASSPNASSVIGKMPNVPANRLSNQLNITGPGFTVSREELSGDGALELALAAIQRGEIDAAIVGAVELGVEKVHQTAISLLSCEAQPASDAAVLLVVKSLQQAELDDDEILALVSPTETKITADKCNGAHAAAGLINLSAGIQKLRAGHSDKDTRGIKPSSLTVTNNSVFGESTSWELSSANRSAKKREPENRGGAFASTDHPLLERYAADDRNSLITRLKKGQQHTVGECRVAIVGKKDDFEKLRQRAIKGIQSNKRVYWSLDGVSFSEKAIEGEVASVFTGAASSYPEMGSELFLGFPDISRKLAEDMPSSADAMCIASDPRNNDHKLPGIQLAGSSYLSQLHARITQDMLKIKSDVAMGLSSGETNSMFAFGVWQDMDGLRADIDSTELYKSALAEDFSAIREAWDLPKEAVIEWDNFIVLAPIEDVRKTINKEDKAYLTIVQSEKDAVIGGDRKAIKSVLSQLGNPDTIPLGHDLAVHCEVVEPFEAIWRKLHTRKTSAPKGIRFYSNFLGGSYKISKAKVADALTGQALNTVDFPKIVEEAYKDGVRIFIEHGPRNSLTNALDTILGDRPHLALALDNPSIPAMTQVYRTIASLWCAGVVIDFSQIKMNTKPVEKKPEPSIRFALRLPEITLQASMQRQKTQTYRPPMTSAGPEEGQLIPAAPALAFTIKPNKTKHGTAKAAPRKVSLPVPIRAPAVVNKVLRPQTKQHQTAVAKPAALNENKNPALIAEPSTLQIPMTAVNEHQLLVQGHHQMLEAHQAFLAAQMQGQQAFEATMSKMQSVLLGVTHSTTASAVAPIVTPTSTEAKPRQAAPLSAVAPLPKEPEINLQKNIVEPVVQKQLPGPSFSREQLEVLSSGQISSVLGPLFEQQDAYDIQVRMPEPPLLLCDRVLGIKGEAGSMGTGTIWTETDVKTDSWYLHNGRMPPGIFIESGQADLLLISWLGIDFHNKGDRAYRLLGCELVFHGELPQPGETLEYEIKVDGHANQGDVRLFFFHYDCHINGELRISVRNGQAGFFTKEELADSAGVLWEAESSDYSPNFVKAEAGAHCPKTAFTRAEMASYLAGDLQACFGDEFSWAHTHTRTPGSPEGKGNFLGEVTHFEPEGGPSSRGYLRIVEDIHEDDWFFDGHFNNDPCMPGTLMADACLQAMAFYMSARGRTLHKDGWRFQPVRSTNYKFVCRGQALPESSQLVYEIFVDEEIVDDQPQLFAHVLCTIDGRKAFLCERLGLQLVPDWPLSSMPELLDKIEDDRPLAYINDFPLDYHSLISCAWGKPSTAFGEGFAHYDGPLRSPRLPGPPYHFMTRIIALDGEMASMKKGGKVEALYDIPPDAWFFDDNASDTMPFCVLMEIALQPCGWLASYTLGRDYATSDLLFRNLDGTGTQHKEILRNAGSLKTTATMTSLSQIGELIIENFEVLCTIDDEPVFSMKTVFGFFPPDAMENQKGLTITDAERIIFDQESNELIDLTNRNGLYFDHPSAHLPNSKLLMVDRITYLDPTGGEKDLGSIRGEKTVDITEWFFKAHFFQDPVQPGSLGIEAMIQVMQALMMSQGLHNRFIKPRFEPVLIKGETEWHYRGQITPKKSLITIDFQCNEQVVEENETWIIGDARLWGDGLKIYHAPRIGLKIVEDDLGLATKNKTQPKANWKGVRDYWVTEAGEHYLVHDLGAALIHKFVRELKLQDADAFVARRGQPAIYLANHQVGVESFLFLGMIAAMTGIPAEAIAKQEHKDTWLGQISDLTEAELQESSTTRMLFFDREDQSDMLRILNNFGETIKDQPRSLLVHVDGTRAKKAGQATEKVSSVLIDLAIKYQIPIIPVRFAGGLPLNASEKRLEFPVAYGSQDFHIGKALAPSKLEALPYAERSRTVVSLLNNLGPTGKTDIPNPGDIEFDALVKAQLSQSSNGNQRTEIQAVIWSALKTIPNLGQAMQTLLEKLEAGDIENLNAQEQIVATLLG